MGLGDRDSHPLPGEHPAIVDPVGATAVVNTSEPASVVGIDLDAGRLIVAGDVLVSKRSLTGGGTTLAPIDAVTGVETWQRTFATDTTVWRVTPAGWVLKSADRIDCETPAD